MMKLIQIKNDVYAACDVSALMLNDTTVTVLLRGNDEGWETEFETEEEAIAAIKAATESLVFL